MAGDSNSIFVTVCKLTVLHLRKFDCSGRFYLLKYVMTILLEDVFCSWKSVPFISWFLYFSVMAEEDFDPEKCVTCLKSFLSSEKVVVGSKGLNTVLHYCKLRERPDLESYTVFLSAQNKMERCWSIKIVAAISLTWNEKSRSVLTKCHPQMLLRRDSDRAWSHFLGKIIVFYVDRQLKRTRSILTEAMFIKWHLLDFDKQFFTSVTKEMTTGAMKSTQGLQQVMI